MFTTASDERRDLVDHLDLLEDVKDRLRIIGISPFENRSGNLSGQTSVDLWVEAVSCTHFGRRAANELYEVYLDRSYFL